MVSVEFVPSPFSSSFSRFSAFQIFGAWSNTGKLTTWDRGPSYGPDPAPGMSLVAQSMVPFQTAYPLVIFMVICALAGNTCLVSLPSF